MKKILVACIFICCFEVSVKAQQWEGAISHNGYSCYLLKTSNNITAYAARGVDGNLEVLFIKIQVPYNWGNTGTGHVNVFAENLATGSTKTQSVYYHYNNGWLYIIESLPGWCSVDIRRGKLPCNNYTITIYEKNDHGRSGGNKIAVNMCLDRLNTSIMPMNKVSFETYW